MRNCLSLAINLAAACILLCALSFASAQSRQAQSATDTKTSSSVSRYGLPGIYPATQDHAPPAWFIDVADKAGLHALDVNGGIDSKRYIIESTGSGVAIFDYDNDGWPDIFLVNGSFLADSPPRGPGQPSNYLFHNNHDGTFTDVTARAGLLSSGWGQGVCVGDYDNDGYDDLYVTSYGKNRLYHNQGDGTFKEVAEQSGVAGSGKEWGTGCSFVDYDRDGKLDLMVSNYVEFQRENVPGPGQAMYCVWKSLPVFCGPRGLPSAPNILYHNLGNGKFEDVSKSSGIQKTTGHYCFSVSTLDYDDDGWPDIYIACDSTPAILYHNNHDGTFTDTAADAGVAFNEDGREQAGMGTTVADYDGDGRLDIFKTNFSDDTSTLYRNNGDGTFIDTTFQSGVGVNPQDLGWGTMFMDMDNDGWPDLLVANGHVYPAINVKNAGSSYQEPRIVYHNLANGKFADLSLSSGPGITVPASSRGLAIGDLWNDGRLEAVVNNMNQQPMLLVNVARNSNHWIGVRLIGTRANRDGINARVTVYAGSRRWVDEVRSGSSFDSSNDLRLHFGLGALTRVDRIVVRWPAGLTESFSGSDADGFVTLREGSGHSGPR